jgi:cytochrome c
MLIWFAGPVFGQLRGHGGPVRALAVSPEGARLASTSFDSTAIIWSLASGTAERVLRFHQGAVNAVAFLPGGRVATSGEDARIAIWPPNGGQPANILEGHTAPVAALTVSPDGKMLASASWDNTVRLWSLDGGAPRVLEGHQQNVNGVAFTPDGQNLVSVGYDLTLRIWHLKGNEAPKIITLPTPLNTVAVAANGDIVTAGASGKVHIFTSEGLPRSEVDAASVPIIALAVSANGNLLAASNVRGAVAIIDRPGARLVQTLVGPGLPAWAVAFLPDGKTVLTGGTDRLIRQWNALTGEHLGEVAMAGPPDPLARFGSDHGAEVYRACVACHTLKADEGPRAGPTLEGIFGRRIASLPGYDFSPALKNMNIVWTPETVSKLFEVGPAAYTPGTKMPEQRVGAEDRKALVEFLKKATRPGG